MGFRAPVGEILFAMNSIAGMDDAVLGDGAWAAVPRRALHSGLGRAEASSGYALVAAAALVARGEASEALVLGGMRSAVMATLLRKPGA